MPQHHHAQKTRVNSEHVGSGHAGNGAQRFRNPQGAFCSTRCCLTSQRRTNVAEAPKGISGAIWASLLRREITSQNGPSRRSASTSVSTSGISTTSMRTSASSQ